jgi:excisionase family DNA binding protein
MNRKDHGVETELAGEGFMTVPEASQFLRLSRATVYLLMDSGELGYAKFGRSRRIARRALEEFVQRCTVGARGEGV